MDCLTDIFSHLCGQDRCFVVDGAALPVCQRCLGLYAGAAVTGAWLAMSGTWRRGLPSRSIVLVNVAMLLTAMAGGMHAIDLGPMWRLICGLWTGHVTILWLVLGAAHLFHLSRAVVRPQPPWTRRDRLQAVALAAGLTMLAAAFGPLRWLGWDFWTAVVSLGAAMLLGALLAATVAVAVWFSHAALRGFPFSRTSAAPEKLTDRKRHQVSSQNAKRSRSVEPPTMSAH